MLYTTLLRHRIADAFSLDDVRVLCADLSVDYDELPGETKSARIAGLIDYLNRRDRLDELVRVLKDQRSHLDLDPKGMISPDGVASALGEPSRFGRGVLLDTSHRQHTWPRRRASTIFNQLPRIAEDVGVDFHAIGSRNAFTVEQLSPWQGLIMPMPPQAELDDETILELVQWVRGGGHMAVLGFELGDRHHESNVNRLCQHFGLWFNTDIVAPPAWALGRGVVTNPSLPPSGKNACPWPIRQKPYYEPIDFEVEDQSRHPVLKGVETLRWWGVCTLNTEPGSQTLVPLGRNWVAHMLDELAVYEDSGRLNPVDQLFHLVRGYHDQPVVAAAHPTLVRAGGVIAIGTWDLLSHGTAATHNELFIQNLLKWLARLI